MKFIIAKFKNKSGSFPIFAFIIIFVLLTFSCMIMEVYRVHSLQSHVEYELQRAVNIAVEEAMHDTWRIDKFNKLDTAQATADFYDYLYNDLELTHTLEKMQDGKKVYTLQFNGITTTYDPPRLFVKGNLKLKSAFDFLVGEVNVPFQIASKNKRID